MKGTRAVTTAAISWIGSTFPVQANPSSNSPSDKSDRDLIKDCVAGDTQSFRRLYRRHQNRVRALLHQLCDHDAIDDLVQEVFLRVWKGLPKFRQSSQFSTWLYRIVWNVASDYRQSAAVRRSRLEVLTQHAPKQQEAPDLIQLHYQDIVMRGLKELSFDHRTILVLHDLEGMQQKEVAEILEIPVGTAKSRLFHARASMRQFLDRQGVQL
ncbi:MAG: sigma-70 family RNA polymerase sigma factor [Plectolyngbya sp. WJT66-NPBG17]|jgi:RNA polymerase sigma-70 factor (ECF subfamily)|nr:sigma-70 family RNA polymerase sigma factor [Plectolyngbya sp. WJT66-NPBG17]MBW4523659.1 sigma-70 family RNA polymerase sigma factor [Phormidium tanganyikae FI6-MK23]